MTHPAVWGLSADSSRLKVQLHWRLCHRRWSMFYWRDVYKSLSSTVCLGKCWWWGSSRQSGSWEVEQTTPGGRNCTHFCATNPVKTAHWKSTDGDLHSTACEAVHHPNTVIPRIVVAVVTIGRSVTHSQLMQNDTMTQIWVRYGSRTRHSCRSAALTRCERTDSSILVTYVDFIEQVSKQPSPVTHRNTSTMLKIAWMTAVHHIQAEIKAGDNQTSKNVHSTKFRRQMRK